LVAEDRHLAGVPTPGSADPLGTLADRARRLSFERLAVRRRKRGVSPVRVAIGSDHAGYRLKEHFVAILKDLGHEVEDLGTHSEETVDYPPFCFAVGSAVVEGRAERGIVLGGSGQGEQIAANKVKGVRAALCNDLYTARLSRQHNDANVLSMGGRIVAFDLADEILKLWLETPFQGGRHVQRLEQIADWERRA